MSNKELFLQIYNENIKREGSAELLEFLCSKSSDFFTAPASTKFHGSFEGGLLEHSLNVYKCLKSYLESERVKEFNLPSYSNETIALVALLHDVCKVNVYKTSTRNVKNEHGVWEQVPYYEFSDSLPYGHGEKSVYILSGFIKLSREEAFAIRYHMGFSGDENKNMISNALERFPLAMALFIADMEATMLLESKK